MAVFTITRNSPPATASRALSEREASFFANQALTFALVLVGAQRNIASHDKGIVNATRMRVAFITPKILVVATSDPSATIIPNIVSVIPTIQYNFLFHDISGLLALSLQLQL